MDLDFNELGFLWPEPQALMNIYDETLDIEPSGVSGDFWAADESAKQAYRLYRVGFREMTELEVMHWVCGGVENWYNVLQLFRTQIGDNKPTRYGNVISKMSRLGVNPKVTELTILRLIRGNRATLKGVGDNALFTITKW